MPSLKVTLSNLLLKNADYRSDTTDFIMNLKRARPELEAQQQQGRALLWDQNIDRNHIADAQVAKVKQSAYVYGTKHA
jgi:hypothetical protein